MVKDLPWWSKVQSSIETLSQERSIPYWLRRADRRYSSSSPTRLLQTMPLNQAHRVSSQRERRSSQWSKKFTKTNELKLTFYLRNSCLILLFHAMFNAILVVLPIYNCKRLWYKLFHRHVTVLQDLQKLLSLEMPLHFWEYKLDGVELRRIRGIENALEL